MKPSILYSLSAVLLLPVISTLAPAQTTTTLTVTGNLAGGFNNAANWSNGLPTSSSSAIVTTSGLTAGATISQSTTNGTTTMSGLAVTNSSDFLLTISSWQTANTEAQTLTFENATPGQNVAVTTAGTGTGGITLRGRFVLNDDVDFTLAKPLTMTMNGVGIPNTSTGQFNILDGALTIRRNASEIINAPTGGARYITIGDGTGAAGTASLVFSQTNMFSSTADTGNNSAITVKSDGLFSTTYTTGSNTIGTDSTANSALIMHGGAQASFATGGRLNVRGSGAQAVLQVANQGSASTATISGGTLQVDLAAAGGTGTREISIAKNAASGVADLHISSAFSDGDDNMTYNKTGNGILQLSADNSTTLDGTGTWNINAGGLLVENTAGSGTGAASMSLTIDNGAALGGDGAIAGNISFLSGANFYFSTTKTLDVTGSVSFANFGVTNLLGLDSSVPNATYTLLNGTGLNISTANVSNIGLGSAYDLGSGKLAYLDFSNGGDLAVVIDYAAVPEPSTYAAWAGLAALGFVAARRRRAAQVKSVG